MKVIDFHSFINIVIR